MIPLRKLPAGGVRIACAAVDHVAATNTFAEAIEMRAMHPDGTAGLIRERGFE
jgi:hypothetical protein